MIAAFVGAVGVWVIIAAFIGGSVLWDMTPEVYRAYLGRLVGFLAISACGSLAAIILATSLGWM
jgi:hypothetical protein